MAVSTRDRLLAAARHLLAEDEPSATLAEVARHAGVSRATLHRHFASRAELLRAVNRAPAPDARQRVLAAAMELLARDGLAQLSMDELAERASISRANLYRLVPGKAALFRELVRVYSPLEPIGATITRLGDQPPEIVMPAVARAIARHLAGRVGLVRSLLFEASGAAADTDTARDLALRTALGPMRAYVQAQIQAGRLRPVPPALALQAFAGPILMQLLLGDFLGPLLGQEESPEQTVAQLAELWVAGMRPRTEAS